MFEALVAATATTGLFALAKGIRGNHQYRVDPQLVVTPRDERGDDLPCPMVLWAYQRGGCPLPGVRQFLRLIKTDLIAGCRPSSAAFK